MGYKNYIANLFVDKDFVFNDSLIDLYNMKVYSIVHFY